MPAISPPLKNKRGGRIKVRQPVDRKLLGRLEAQRVYCVVNVMSVAAGGKRSRLGLRGPVDGYVGIVGTGASH